MGQLTHGYISRVPEQREENLFLEEYYSGTDTKVYIDDEKQTEISHISYSLSEQLKPMYGYASRTWDDVAVGTRIVTGMIKVPIKNPEEQSTYEEVVLGQNIEKDKSTSEKVEDMNSESEAEKENQGWIDDSKKDDQNESTSEWYYDAEVEKYQRKLNSLGYPIPTIDGMVNSEGDCNGFTSTAIIKFCRDNGINEAKGFRTHVKNKIDELLDNQKLKEIEIYFSTPLRVGPGEQYGIIMNLPKSKVYFLDAYQDKITGTVWNKIRTKDLMHTGYIENQHPE